ncbi:MAG TPA: hypothetical protein VMH30_07370 [Verrucomicrobiae bacterium]|nr:hypothetical protein [Verrucomicrobiae bacterium]
MPIGPVSNSHRQISVVEPVSPALERVKQMLFHPFDAGKWFVIGFCAWLAGLGESGGGSFGGNNFNSTNTHSSPENFRDFVEKARDFTLHNLFWIVPLAASLFLFLLALWAVLLWLNCRGKFMFLHCVALDKAEVIEPWNKFAAPANSFFWFRLVLGLAGMFLMLPPMGLIAVLIIKMVLAGAPDVAAILIAAGLVMFMFLTGIIFALIRKFNVDFVVPILYLRGGTCLAAWGEFWKLLCANAGLFTLFILFQIAITMAIGVLVLFAVLLTCCVAGCLLLIPYIGTVLLLPVLIFKRSFSLYFLRQFGATYDVFPPSPPSPAVTGLAPVAPAA